MKKLLCFLLGVMLTFGFSYAQGCIGVSPANINAVAGGTSTFTLTFQHAGLADDGKYALEYEFYYDGALLTIDSIADYIDMDASTFTHAKSTSVQIGSYLTMTTENNNNVGTSYYPNAQFLVGGNYSNYPLNYFSGKYLNTTNVNMKLNVKWVQAGNYTIKIFLVEMNGGTAETRLQFATGRVQMGGKGATRGGRIMSLTLNTTQTGSSLDTAVCYTAFPVTIGDQTWTSSEVWQDGGTAYEYVTKTVHFYTPGSNVCDPNLAPGLDSISEVTLRRMPQLTISLNAQGHNTSICQNTTAGYVSVAFEGGKSPYQVQAYKGGQIYGNVFESDQADNNYTVSELGAGTYIFKIKDAAGCEASTEAIVISELANDNVFTINTTKADVVCNGKSTGSITITGLTGTYAEPLTYSWAGPESFTSTSQNLTTLEAGNYTVTVTDNKGCKASTSVEITEGLPITNTDQVAVCANLTPYKYQNIDTIAWTESGTYPVRFVTPKGCDSIVTVTFTVYDNPTATISGDTAICAGGTATLKLVYTGELPISAKVNGTAMPLTANTPSPYSFDVQPGVNTTYTITEFVDNNGCAIQTNTSSAVVTVNTNPAVNSITVPDANTCPFSGPWNVTANVTNGSSDELTYHWTGAVEGQNAGEAVVAEGTDARRCDSTYKVSVYVTDANTCKSNTQEASFLVKDATLPVISTYPTSVEAAVGENCVFTIPNFTDTIRPRVTETCGIDTIYQLPEAGTVMQAGDNAQSVTITVKDLCGNTQTATITVSVPVVLNATVSSAESFCYNTADGKIVVGISGGKTPYTLQLGNENPVQTSNTSYTFENLADGQYSIAVSDDNGCALAQNLSATVAQIATDLKVTALDAEKTYDGSALTNAGYKVEFGAESYTVAPSASATLSNGDVVTAVISGTITNVGAEENTVTSVTVTRNSTDITCYYNIVKTAGTLEVTRSNAMTVTCPSGNDITKKYDGTALQPTNTVANIVDGTTIVYSLDSSSWSTTAPSITNVGTQKVYVKAINANYDTAVCGYTLEVTKRQVTLTSASESKTYDGTALTNSSITVTGDGWAGNEGAIYNVTGTITDMGDTANVFTAILNSGTLIANYDTSMVFGTLTINKITTPITITARSHSKTYDGTALTESGYDYTQNVLVPGDVLSAVVTGTITHYAENQANNNVVTSYKVMRGQVDATANYTFDNPVAGTISIKQRKVKMTSASDEQVYDGTALTNDNVTVTLDGWATNEGATYTVTGTQTEVGTSANKFTATLNQGTVISDYDTTMVFGTLTVTPLSGVVVTIKGETDTVTYDGTLKDVQGYSFAASSDLYTANCYTFTGSAYASNTEVGTYNMNLSSTQFTNTSNNFTNVTFNVTDGFIKIERAPMTVAATGYDAKYDGQAHTATVNPSVEAGTTIQYSLDSNVWVPDAPTITDFGTLKVYVRTVNSNYDTAACSCILNVTKREIAIQTADSTKEFDGNAMQKAVASILGDGFVGEEGIDITSSSSITEVGQVENEITYDFKANTKAINYVVTDTILGHLTVTKSDDMEVICPAEVATSKKYDGTALNPVATVQGVVGQASTVIYYRTLTNNNWSEWSDVAPSITHVADGPMSVMVKAENANYINDTCYYTLTINRREVSLTSSDGSKEYDGTVLVNNNIAIGLDGFVGTEGIIPSVTGKKLSCGATTNLFTYQLKDNTAATDYKFDTIYGTLTITPCQEQVHLTAGSRTKPYDGTALTESSYVVDGLLGNDQIVNLSMADTCTITNVGTKANVIASYTIMNGDTNVTDCYEKVDTIAGVLTVNPTTVYITSADIAREYNGDTLRNGTTPMASETGWFGNDGATYNFTGEQTLVGSSANSFGYTLNDGVIAANYIIDTTYGRLTVTDRDPKWEITIVSESETVNYDAAFHTINTFETLEFTQNNHVYTVEGVTAYIWRKAVGTYKTAISGTPLVRDAYQNDVTDQFIVKADTGELKIEPAVFTLTCPSGNDITKTYDGTALAPVATAVWYDEQHNAINPQPAFNIEYHLITGSWPNAAPSLTEVGSIDVDVRAQNSNFVTQNCNYTLTVNKADSVVVTAKDSTIIYNAQELTNAGYTVKFGSETYVVSAANAAIGATLSTGDVVKAVVTGSITDAGTTPNTITSVSVTNANGDASANYLDVKQHNGTLTVNKKLATLISADSTKNYDGSALTRNEMRVDTGWIGNQGVDVVYTGTQTIPGSSDNSFTYTAKEGTNLDNYQLTVQFGLLTVTADTNKIAIASESKDWTYDGEAHTNYVYAVTYNNQDVAGTGNVYTLPTGDELTIIPSQTATITNYTVNGVSNAYTYTLENSSYYATAPTTTYGVLMINKRPVSMVSADSSKIYDGTELRNGRVTATGFVQGEGAVYNVTGSATHVADTRVKNNVFDYTMNLNTLADNYEVDSLYGTLTILPKETKVFVEGHVDSVGYDGQPHVTRGYDFISDTANMYAANYFRVKENVSDSVKATEQGTYYIGLDGDSFENTNADFDNVVFEVIDGHLTIEPGTMTLTCPTGSDTVQVYDGTALEPEAICDVPDGTTIKYSIDNGLNWNTTAPSISHVYESLPDVMVVATNANYKNDTCHYRLAVKPATVTLVSKDSTKYYDGQALVNNNRPLLTETGWVGNDGATYTFTNEITEVGDIANRFTMEFNNGTDSRDYIIDSTFGTLKVEALPGITVTVNGNSDVLTYDGESHTVSGYTIASIKLGQNDYTGYTTADFEFIGSVSDSTATSTNADSVAMNLTSSSFQNLNSNFTTVNFVIANQGYIKINPIDVAVSIKGERDTAIYDGVLHEISGFTAIAAVTNPAYNVNNVALAPNSTAYAARTNFGVTTMGLQSTDFVNNDANYNVTFSVAEDGQEVIEKAPVTVYVTGNTSIVTYNAQAQSVHGYALSASSDEYNVDSVQFVGLVTDSTITQTDKGIYFTTWTSNNFSNIDADFEVTFNIAQAQLTIRPDTIAVAITGDQVTKVYDAQSHNAQGWTAVATPDNHGLDLDTKIMCSNPNANTPGISRSDIDTTWMYLAASQFTCTDANYYVTFTVAEDGYVAIVPDTVVVNIVGNTATLPYNGAEQSVTGYVLSCTDQLLDLSSDIDYTGDSIAKGTDVSATAYPMNLDVNNFSCNNNNFYVTFNLVSDGALTIEGTAVVVTVTGNTDSHVYDGASHKVTGYTITSDVDSYTANIATLVSFTGAASDTIVTRTHAGDSLMTMNENMFTNTDDNYTVQFTVTPGKMSITPVVDLVTVTIKGERDTVEYTGVAQRATGYEATADNVLYDVNDVDFNGDSIATGTAAANDPYWMGMTSAMFSNGSEDFTNVSFTLAEDGLLKINKAAVTVEIVGDTVRADFDGNEHQVSGYRILSISNDLYNASMFTFAPAADSIATRTEEGSTPMAMTAANFTNNNDNFDVTFDVVTGAVIINPASVTVTITGNSAEFDYDGNPHTVTGYTAEASSTLYDVTNSFTFVCTSAADTTATRTDEGTTYMNMENNANIVVTNTNSNFGQVDFIFVNGSVTIYPEFTAAVAAADVKPVKCNGEHNGEAVVTISGGKTPYTFAFTQGSTQAGNVIGNTLSMDTLAAGDYVINITDSLLNTIPVSFTITEPDVLAYENHVKAVACNAGVASDTVRINGGNAPYQISWNDAEYTNVTTSDANGVYFLANNLTASATAYTFKIKDSKGCEITDGSVTITEPDELVITVSNESVAKTCAGNDTTVKVEVVGGTTDYAYIWEVDGSVVENNLPTYNVQSMLYGDHTFVVTVKDANGCEATTSTIDVVINPVYNIVQDVYIVRGTTYTIGTDVYNDGDELPVQYLTSVNDCDSIVTGHVYAYGLAIQFTDTCTMQQSSYTRAYALTPDAVHGEWPLDSVVKANVNEEKMFFTYFTNPDNDAQWSSEKVDMSYELYKDGLLVENFDDCLDAMKISTYYDRTATYYGMPLTSAVGEIPGNTFQLQLSANAAIKYYNYFNFNAFVNIPNKVQITFTETGEYTLKLKLEKRVGGVAGTQWTGVYNPYIVNRRLGPIFGGYNNVPDEKVTIAARDLKIVVGAPEAAQNNVISSINTYAEGVVSLYPNPVREQLNLHITGMEGKTQITIVDAQGRVMANVDENISGEVTHTYNTSNYAQGVYFVYVRNNGQMMTRKFIVTK